MPCNILKKSPSSAGHSPPPNPQQSPVWRRSLPKGRTRLEPQRKKLAQGALARCTGAGAAPAAVESSGNESRSAGSWERARESCPGDREQTLRSQTQQTLGLQIVLTTDGYTCLPSVWSLVTVLVKSPKMLPFASKHYYCFIWIEPRVSDFHPDTGGHSGVTLELHQCYWDQSLAVGEQKQK